jgi:hypothetical protein
VTSAWEVGCDRTWSKLTGRYRRRFKRTLFGMSICKRLARLMSGDVQAFRTASGTLILFDFNVTVLPPQTPSDEAQVVELRRFRDVLRHKRVLLTCLPPVVHEHLVKTLRRWNMKCLAIDQITSSEFDVSPPFPPAFTPPPSCLPSPPEITLLTPPLSPALGTRARPPSLPSMPGSGSSNTSGASGASVLSYGTSDSFLALHRALPPGSMDSVAADAAEQAEASRILQFELVLSTNQALTDPGVAALLASERERYVIGVSSLCPLVLTLWQHSSCGCAAVPHAGCAAADRGRSHAIVPTGAQAPALALASAAGAGIRTAVELVQYRPQPTHLPCTVEPVASHLGRQWWFCRCCCRRHCHRHRHGCGCRRGRRGSRLSTAPFRRRCGRRRC